MINAGTVQAELDVNAKKYNQGMEKATRVMINFGNMVKQKSQEMQSSLDALDKKQKLWSMTTDKVTRALHGNAKEYDALKQKINIVTKEIDTHEKKLEEVRKEYGTSSRQAKEYEDALLDLKIQQAELNQEMEKFTLAGKLEAVGNQMVEFGKSWTKKVTAPIVAAGTAVVRTTAKFDDQMSTVRAISGATGAEFDKLRNQARELGRETRFSASEAAQGMTALAQMGFDVNEIYSAMPGMMNLAAAGALELGDAAGITANTLRAFGLEASQAGHVADVLAYAAANAGTDVQGMGQSMEYLAPIAKDMGWSLEETSAAVMALGDAGIYGAKAGAAFSTSLGRLAKPTDDAATLMKQLNLEFFDANGVMKPLPSIVGELEEKLADMTPQQKSAALTTLFGAEAYKHWSILVSRGSAELARMTKELETSDGAARKMAEDMEDNFAGSWRSFMSAVSDVAIALGDALVPTIRNVTDKLTELTRWFSQLDPAIQSNIVKVGALAAAIGPLSIAGGKLATSIAAMTKGYKFLTASIIPAITAKVADKAETLALIGLYAKDAIAKGASTAATTAMTAATTAWNVVAGIATTATTGLGAAITFLTGPVGLAIAAFAALVAGGIALYKNWDTVMQKCSELKENVVSKTNEMKEGALKRYNELKTGAIKAIDEKKTAIIEKWTELKNDAYEWAGRMMEQFKEGITDKIEAVKTAASNVGSAIAKVLRFRSPTEEGPLSDSDRWMPNFMQMLADGINQNSDKVKESSDSVAQKIGNSLGKVNNYVTHTVGIIEKEFKLWALSNDMVKDSSEYLSQQLEVQKQKHEILNQHIEVTSQALQKIIEKYGEGSAQAIEYKNKLLDLKVAHAELGKEIDETTGKIEKQTEALERQFEVIERGRSSLVRSGSRFVSRSSGGSSGGKKDGDWYVWTGSDGKIKSGDKSDFDKDTGYDVDDSEVRRIARDNNVDMGVARDMAAENKRKGKKVWHDGGWVGKPLFDIENMLALIQKRLRYNEIAGILQEGEFVLSRDMLSRIQSAMTSVDMVTTPRTTPTPQATRSAPTKGGDIHQHITINSPTPLTPSEIARKNLQVSRQLAMEWGL